MLKRVITGLLASAYVITMVLLGRTVLVINVVLLLVIGTHEILSVLWAGGFHPVKWAYYLYALLLVPAYLWLGERGVLLLMLAGAMTAMAATVCHRVMPHPLPSPAWDGPPADPPPG